MGYGRWEEDSYATYSRSVQNQSREQVYTSRNLNTNLDPSRITFRESRDSETHPVSTPLIFGLDVTGSMGFIAEEIAKTQLGRLVNSILQRQPVLGPHLMFMGLGDAVAHDKAPLQVTQFEPDNVIVDQLTDIWLEAGGGGNNFESYDLAWGFAAAKTRTDAWDKRGKKGYLFTIGDERFPYSSDKSFLNRNVYPELPAEVGPASMLAEAQERYNVFHVVIEEGYHASRHPHEVQSSWDKHLGARVLYLNNYHYLPELIVTAIAISEGADVDETIASWGSDAIANVLRRAFRLEQVASV